MVEQKELWQEDDDVITLLQHPRLLNLQRNSANSWTAFVKHVDEDQKYVIQQGSASTITEALYNALNQGKK